MAAKKYTKIYLLPIIVFLWLPLTFVVTYFIAVHSKNVLPFMPYISDIGSYSPESCLFGQMLNTGSFLMAFTTYVRYRQVQDIFQTNSYKSSLQSTNKIAFWLSIIASIGVSVVGNFQATNWFVIHLLGASAAFGLGTCYQIVETYISMNILPDLGTKNVNYTKMGLSIVSFICSNLTGIFGGISLLAFDGDDITKWTSRHAGYEAHVASAIAEWITAISTMAYFLTFVNDFKQIGIYEPEIEILNSTKDITENNRY